MDLNNHVVEKRSPTCNGGETQKSGTCLCHNSTHLNHAFIVAERPSIWLLCDFLSFLNLFQHLQIYELTAET
jgi:hypothetical protein